jgi:hypothetical protein
MKVLIISNKVMDEVNLIPDVLIKGRGSRVLEMGFQRTI